MAQATAPGPLQFKEIALRGLIHRAHVRKGVAQAKAFPQQPGSHLQIKDMAVGDLIVYSNTEESVRWATSASLELNGSKAPAKTLIASAARRIGNNVYLVQTATQVISEQDTLRAVSALDDWLTRVWAFPE